MSAWGRKNSGFLACTHANRARMFTAAARYYSKEYTLYGPLKLQEVETRRISRQSAHERGTIVSPMHRPSLLPMRHTCYSFLFVAEPRAMVPHLRIKLKTNPVTHQESNLRPSDMKLNSVRITQTTRTKGHLPGNGLSTNKEAILTLALYLPVCSGHFRCVHE
jgi:hypothetical protein